MGFDAQADEGMRQRGKILRCNQISVVKLEFWIDQRSREMCKGVQEISGGFPLGAVEMDGEFGQCWCGLAEVLCVIGREVDRLDV